MFKTNVGSTDRVLRITLGLGLLALVFVGPKTPGVARGTRGNFPGDVAFQGVRFMIQARDGVTS